MQEHLVVWSRFLILALSLEFRLTNQIREWYDIYIIMLRRKMAASSDCVNILRLHTCSSIRWSRNCCSQCIPDCSIRQTQWWVRKVYQWVSLQQRCLSNTTNWRWKIFCLATLPLIFDYIKYDYLDSCTQRSTVVIISPLVSLMKDQVRIYSEKLCAYRRGTERLVCKATSTKHTVEYQIVYASPEFFITVHLWRDVLSIISNTCTCICQ